MRYVLLVALLLVSPGLAQAQTAMCTEQVRAATAMIDEFQEQVRLLSGRAAAYYGRMKTYKAQFAAAQAEIARLKTESNKGK